MKSQPRLLAGPLFEFQDGFPSPFPSADLILNRPTHLRITLGSELPSPFPEEKLIDGFDSKLNNLMEFLITLQAPLLIEIYTIKNAFKP
jgi:hypothetical protein